MWIVRITTFDRWTLRNYVDRVYGSVWKKFITKASKNEPRNVLKKTLAWSERAREKHSTRE